MKRKPCTPARHILQITVEWCEGRNLDQGGGGGGGAGTKGPAQHAEATTCSLLDPGKPGWSGDGGGEVSMPSSCSKTSLSDVGLLFFLALVSIGEMTGLWLMLTSLETAAAAVLAAAVVTTVERLTEIVLAAVATTAA